LHCGVLGLDFDRNATDYCNSTLHIDAIHGEVGSLATKNERFDLITMWHYLEHEPDPRAALVTIRECLGRDGHLVVEVPNADSLENALFRSRSYLYDVPRHLYNFCPTTIPRLLNKAGFDVLSVHFRWFTGGWIGTAQSLLAGGRVYRELKGNIFLFLLLSQLIFPFDYLSSKAKKGSIMTVVAKAN
jgi:hypothetical protein